MLNNWYEVVVSRLREGATRLRTVFANSQLPSDLFESARLKLTFFYFGILAVFCLVLTFGVRDISNYELNRNGGAERGIVRQLFQHYYTNNGDTPALTYPGAPGDHAALYRRDLKLLVCRPYTEADRRSARTTEALHIRC